MVVFKVASASILMTFSFLVMGCSNQPNQEPITSLFDTKTEAEKAAKKFNCKGAHKMGKKWMPCMSHENNQKNITESGHVRHHH